MSSLTFKFEELPLIIEGAFKDNGVTGQAEISYHRDGEWSIVCIGIETTKFLKEPVNGKHWIDRIHWLDAGTPLYLIIYHRLEHEWRDKVQDAVNEALAEDRASLADDYADYRRDELKHVEAV